MTTAAVEIRLRSTMSVELIKAVGSDADIIAAARVSTAGENSKESIDADPNESAGLIRFLMANRHGSPFEHAIFTFLVTAPIFVWREHMRHRMFSYNEESARYRNLEPVFYVPARARKLVQVGKPGHYTFSDGSFEQYRLVESSFTAAYLEAYSTYEWLMLNGVAREVARMVLPVGIYSSAYVTGNARAFMNFLSLRTINPASTFKSFPQREIEMVADRYESLLKAHMPLTMKAFNDAGRVAP